MSVVGEFYILKVKPSTPVQMSVYLMIVGSIVAASNDLAFNLRGYVYVLLNDFFTAGNGVLMKKKLESKDLGKYGVMYYNSLFMLTPGGVKSIPKNFINFYFYHLQLWYSLGKQEIWTGSQVRDF